MKVQIKNGKIFAPLKQQWLVVTPEEEVRQKFIIRLVDKYGFELNHMEQEVKVNNSQRGQGRAMADIVIWKSVKDKNEKNSPAIVIECKAEHITIREEDYFQGYNYASWADADLFVTTNLKETRIFRVVKGKIPNKLEEVVDIPDAGTIQNPEKVFNQTKPFIRDEFSKLLFKCHNILRNNDKLSPEAAFDEISKILFIKIRYERDHSHEQAFSQKQFLKLKTAYDVTKSQISLPFYQQLFERTKEDFIDDDLFDENETIRIRENSFEAIVKELEIYNLSKTSDDVKGIAFEKFLGKTFRGELGQFFTPRTIVNFMVEVLDPQERERICDPCCGSGGFLIKAFEYVRAQIENEIHDQKHQIKQEYYTNNFNQLTQKQKEEIDKKVHDLFNNFNQDLDILHPKSRLHMFSYDCIFAADANLRMARTAKMNMIMHGDGHGGVHHHDGLLNVNGIFENRFDIILINPPFGSKLSKSLKITEANKCKHVGTIEKYKQRYGQAYDKALEQIDKNMDQPILNLYKVGKMSSLTEVVFIERSLNLLKPGGRMGIVLPEGVLNNSTLQKIRDFVESQAKILLITSIPKDVFIASGATIKTSLVFLKKFTEEEKLQWNKITEKVKKQIDKKYTHQIQLIKDKLVLQGLSKHDKKQLRNQLKTLNEKIKIEIKAKIKQEFDYPIPVAKVEKAGISATGVEIENELIPLCKEFTEYRKQNQLW